MTGRKALAALFASPLEEFSEVRKKRNLYLLDGVKICGWNDRVCQVCNLFVDGVVISGTFKAFYSMDWVRFSFTCHK